MQRITIKDLRAVCARLNRVTNSPAEPWMRDADGKLTAAIGNYHISQAYGGYCLQRMYNDGGGVTTPVGMGHVPARECYNAIHAYMSGIIDASEKADLRAALEAIVKITDGSQPIDHPGALMVARAALAKVQA